MSPAAEILVIILSIVLAIFLVLGIVLLAYLIKLSRDIKKVTETASRTVESIESVFAKISAVASPIFIAKMINKFFKKGKKGE